MVCEIIIAKVALLVGLMADLVDTVADRRQRPAAIYHLYTTIGPALLAQCGCMTSTAMPHPPRSLLARSLMRSPLQKADIAMPLPSCLLR